MKFYFDEDSPQHRLIAALRSRALDVTTSLDAGMRAREDKGQLIFAAEGSHVLVSAKASDFALLHRQWREQGRSHSGILIVPQQRYSHRRNRSPRIAFGFVEV